jgi:hypothetical protein
MKRRMSDDKEARGKPAKLCRIGKRCEKDGSGPVLKQIIDEVIAVQPKHAEWLNFFIHNCEGYGWNECSCEYSEATGSLYIQRHGASSLCSNILHFVTYFMPRKMCTPSKNDYTKAGAALRAVIKYCIDNGHLVKDDDTKNVLRQLSIAATFNGQKIVAHLNDLYEQQWWAQLDTTETEVPFSLFSFVAFV